MITYIKCEICGKEIPQKSGPRKYCTHCSNMVAREKQKKYREELREMKIEAGLIGKRSQI